MDFIERWVKDPANHVLARWTFYTENRTPHQTADDIIDHLLESWAQHVSALTGHLPGMRDINPDLVIGAAVTEA